ncbi:MAG: HAD family hydrolase [Syntrophobacteraceae bacterium]
MTTISDVHGVKAVVFDAFGTLAHIGEKRHPYRHLLQKLAAHGRRPQADDASRIMSANVGIAGIAGLFGVEFPASEIAGIEIELYEELASVKLFPDALPVLGALRTAGYKLALCSNLAAPYAIPLKLLLPPLDVYVWSFETGAVKPEPAIYEALFDRLECSPFETMMVGDTLESDYTGPRRLGMRSCHLARDTESPVAENVRTLYEVLDLLRQPRHENLRNESAMNDA